MDYDELIHTGVGHDDDPPGRGSGRFEWGSGENPFQHQFNFLSEYNRLKNNGIKDSEIAAMLLGVKYYKKDGTPVYYQAKDLKAEITIKKSEIKRGNIARATQLLDECNGNVSEVARRMSDENKTWNESSIRSLLNPVLADRRSRYENTANMIKDVIEQHKDDDSKGIIDVSKGTELYLNVTENTKDVALAMLEKEGYTRTWVKIPQLGTDNSTNVMVIAPPGVTWKEIQDNKYNIQSIDTFSPDNGKTWWTPEFPTSVDSSRIMVRYAEEGGIQKDGVIELRRGVEDISLGDAQYAQVRIAVDGTNYMKGMAIYANDSDLPAGVDIIYNTNKHVGTPLIDKNAKYELNPDTGKYDWTGKEVTKRMKINEETMEVDKDNPFGALIKSPKENGEGVTIRAGGQRHYTDANGNDQLSPINKLREEGDWDSWGKTLSSQFLSKQPLQLINQQINISVASKQNELDEIKSLTNPVIKKKLLEDFASNCDSKAADLAVQGFKKQAFQVLLPVTDMKDNEIYAPNYQNGDKVALVRYPHAGTFEIPVLTVNNNQKTAKSVLGNAKDAVGINLNVASQLSGADFDGDTALVIPVTSNNLKIKSTKPLDELKNFEPKELYTLPDSAPKMKSKTKQTEMGKVSNLITDMTLAEGATNDEIARAVKHSMVVIDAEKHHLDYKRSASENDIESLKRKYQGVNEKTGQSKGASTVVSLAGKEARINQVKELTDTKKMTETELKRWNEGYVIYRETGATKIEQVTNPNKMTSEELTLYNAGKKVYRQTDKPKQTKIATMYTVDDAMDLVRDKTNEKEVAYANYANSLKSMARDARREARSIKPTPVNQEAAKTYANEVASLNEKIRKAEMNAPKERKAQALSNAIVSEKYKSNPDMDSEHKKRAQSLALTQARAIVGAGKDKIEITDKEWEAIQSHAITTSKVIKIVNNTDTDAFKERAMPRQSKNTLTASQISMIKAMYASGMYTQAEIASSFGVSTSTVSNAVKSA
jgi:hypothetical protein